MNASVCAALTAVFPLILLTVLLNGRDVREDLRKTGYEYAVAMGVVGGIVGLVVVTVGLQSNGLTDVWAFLAWFCFGISVLGLAWIGMLLVLTFDAEDGKTNFVQRWAARRRASV